MRKHKTYNILNVFLLTLIVIPQLLLSMENQHLPLKELIVRNNVSYFSHDTVCVLVLVDKAYKKIIEDTVELRKKYLKNYVQGTYTSIMHKNISRGETFGPVITKITYIKDYVLPKNKCIITDESIAWNKYGSASSMIDCSKKNSSNSWTFRLVYLANKGFVKEQSYYDYEELYQWPNNQTIPFFNRKGDACFYRISEGIKEYSLSMHRSPQVLPCLIDLQNSLFGFSWLDSLAPFIKFPHLLNAILQSTSHEDLLYVYRQFRHYNKNEKVKVYIINNVIIPDDYVFFQELTKSFNILGYLNKVKNFDDLSDDIKNVIAKRYKEQRGEKNYFECLPKIVVQKNIGALLKRVGRATFKCISKACNSIMWSQDELNNKLINAPEYGDDPKSFFRECGGFEYPCFELKDILQDSNVKLALVQWLLRQWNVSGLQLGHLLFYAAKNKHYDIVEFLENYAKEKGC